MKANFAWPISQTIQNMKELYKYQFFNTARKYPIEIVEAESLNEAMVRAGMGQYKVWHLFIPQSTAVIAPANNQSVNDFLVTWEKVI